VAGISFTALRSRRALEVEVHPAHALAALFVGSGLPLPPSAWKNGHADDARTMRCYAARALTRAAQLRGGRI
jgi:hypothetical protein